MKKIINFILIITVLLINPSYLVVSAESKFARATNPTNLYKLTTNSNELEDIICIVEKSYFVEIIAENGDNYKVNYNGVIGFVKKNDVVLTSSTPKTPFPDNIKLTIGSTCNLRKTPTTKSTTNNIITTIYKNETNLSFIGRVFADEAIDFGGSTWYYVCYNGEYGYIYNNYISSITPIYENTEVVNNITFENSNIENPIVHTPSLIIVILLLLPCLAIILILYLPRKLLIKKTTKHIKEIDKF